MNEEFTSSGSPLAPSPYTIEVERAVVSHPAVLEAAVVAMPDKKWGEVPKAFVTLKPGRTLTVEALSSGKQAWGSAAEPS